MPLEDRFRLRSWSSSIARPSLEWRTSSIEKTTRGNSRRSSPIAFVMSKQVSPKTHPSLMIFGEFFREKFMNFTGNLLLESPNFRYPFALRPITESDRPQKSGSFPPVVAGYTGFLSYSVQLYRHRTVTNIVLIFIPHQQFTG